MAEAVSGGVRRARSIMGSQVLKGSEQVLNSGADARLLGGASRGIAGPMPSTDSSRSSGRRQSGRLPAARRRAGNTGRGAAITVVRA